MLDLNFLTIWEQKYQVQPANFDKSYIKGFAISTGLADMQKDEDPVDLVIDDFH